jgi:hypothetical protein
MRAVWTRARSDLRRHMRAAIVLAVLIGLTSALALAAAAGAQRTATAYERFHAATNAPDSAISSSKGAVAELWWGPYVDFSKVALLPQVEALHTAVMFAGEGVGADGKELFFGGPNAQVALLGAPTIEGQSAMPWKVLEGRLPDPTRSDEVVIGYMKELDPQAAVGSIIDLRLVKATATAAELEHAQSDPEALLGPPIPVKVVGRVVGAAASELGYVTHDIYVTPAFVQRYRSSSLNAEAGLVTLKNGQADAAAFEKGLFAISPEANFASADDEATVVRRAVNVQVVTLWLVALLTTVVGFMIFGQALSRLNFTESMENPILSALGMTRRQLFAVAMVRAAVIGAVAGVVAFAGAVAASALFPTGLARIAEPTPGINISLIVVAGALCVPFGVLLLSVVPALRAARTRGDARGVALVAEFRRPSALAAFVTRSGLPVSVATGVRLALEPGRGRTSVPVRSAIVGLTLAVVALTAAFGFSASFQHLLETPRLYGQFIEMGGGNPFSGGYDEAIAAMVADPGLSDVIVGNFRETVDVQGPGGSVAVDVWGLETLKGSIAPTIAAGAWPVNEGELALGGKTMRQVGAHIGDIVQVRAGDTVVPLKVVGKAVFGDFGFGPGLAEGAGMTFSQLQAFFPDDERTLFGGNFAPGANAEEVIARLSPKFSALGADLATIEELELIFGTGIGAGSLAGAQRVPWVLSGLLALAAIGTLVHTLVMSIRRRRRDLAVLKTLGFVRRQISATVAWQATTMVGIALLIGLPVGVAVGRWGWTLFANAIGVVPVPVVALSPLLIAIPVTLVLANLIALVPGRLAASTQPVAALKAE